jgi:hypothetical protein
MTDVTTVVIRGLTVARQKLSSGNRLFAVSVCGRNTWIKSMRVYHEVAPFCYVKLVCRHDLGDDSIQTHSFISRLYVRNRVNEWKLRDIV